MRNSTRTFGVRFKLLTYPADFGCLYCISLILGLTLTASKRLKGDELSRNGPLSTMRNLLLLLLSLPSDET